MTSTIATAVIVATNRPACNLNLKQVAIVKTAANVYVSGELPNQEINKTAYAEPIAEAGNRTIPFRMESATVGSSVTIAVITAKTGGQFNSIQTQAVINTDKPVFAVRDPAS